MTNKTLFKSQGSKATVPVADTVNKAGGKAYSFDNRHTLAQIAATNCFNGTFYASAKDNLQLAKDAAVALADDPEFIAKVAVYSRDKGYMKDMPAFLCVFLSELDKPLFCKVFRKVITNGKMLRNAIVMARSGAVTSKAANLSAGTWRRMIQEWFDVRSPKAIFQASIGNNPSMYDILRLVHPKPNSPEKNALFGYFLGRDVSFDNLPPIVQQYESFKKDKSGEVPDVDFRMLDSLGIGQREWTEIARNAKWMMTRMNLNTFARHGVFKNDEVTKIIAARLRSEAEIAKAMAFPYQLYVTWREINENGDIPFVVRDAIQDAMEIAIDNVPTVNGKVIVCVDTSGSMKSPITGDNDDKGKPSTVQCVEVAGLIASAVFRKNRSADIWTFNSSAVKVNLNPRDSVVTNTAKLAKAGGGTNISTPLIQMNADKVKADVVLYVSDYESWLDTQYGSNTGLATEWQKFKSRNPKAKLVCCDLTPRNNSQVTLRKDILQVGGFSDSCFDVIASFVDHGFESDHWVSEIEKIDLSDENL